MCNVAKGANASLYVRNKPGRWAKGSLSATYCVMGNVAGTGLQAEEVVLDFITNLKDSPWKAFTRRVIWSVFI